MGLINQGIWNGSHNINLLIKNTFIQAFKRRRIGFLENRTFSEKNVKRLSNRYRIRHPFDNISKKIGFGYLKLHFVQILKAILCKKEKSFLEWNVLLLKNENSFRAKWKLISRKNEFHNDLRIHIRIYIIHFCVFIIYNKRKYSEQKFNLNSLCVHSLY